tara:strand:- start:2382 stop:2591 length:210 start_codon:yes stop_codon:yes gene_type:complete
MRYAKITRTLEDGTIEETIVDLPEVKGTSSTKRKSSRKPKDENEDNTKQKEKQATSANKTSISITRSES